MLQTARHPNGWQIRLGRHIGQSFAEVWIPSGCPPDHENKHGSRCESLTVFFAPRQMEIPADRFH